MGSDQSKQVVDPVEKNRRIFATYPREKLIQFCRDMRARPGGGDGDPSELSDDELRSLALALTQGSCGDYD